MRILVLVVSRKSMVSKSTLRELRHKHLCLFPEDVFNLSFEYYTSCGYGDQRAKDYARDVQITFEQHNRNIISMFFEYNNADVVHFILNNIGKSPK